MTIRKLLNHEIEIKYQGVLILKVEFDDISSEL